MEMVLKKLAQRYFNKENGKSVRATALANNTRRLKGASVRTRSRSLWAQANRIANKRCQL